MDDWKSGLKDRKKGRKRNGRTDIMKRAEGRLPERMESRRMNGMIDGRIDR